MITLNEKVTENHLRLYENGMLETLNFACSKSITFITLIHTISRGL